MNSENKITDSRSKQKIKILLFQAISLFILYSVYSFAINPLYIATATDINYQLTIFPTILTWAFIIIYIASILIYVSVTVFGVYKYGLKDSISSIIITCVGVVYLHVTDTFMIEVSYSYGKSIVEMLTEIFKSDSFGNMLARIGSDLVFYAIIVAVIGIYVHKLKKADSEHYSDRFYPINKFFTFKNPLNVIAFTVALYIFGYLAVSDTIFLIKDTGGTVRVLTVIGEYLVKVIIGFISYVGMLFAFIKYEAQ